MPIDEIAGMVAMRNRFMPAARAMDVASRMGGAIVAVGAISRVQLRHFQNTLIEVAFMRLMQVAIVKIVSMVAVLDRQVAAIRPVNVVVVFVYVVLHL